MSPDRLAWRPELLAEVPEQTGNTLRPLLGLRQEFPQGPQEFPSVARLFRAVLQESPGLVLLALVVLMNTG